MMREITDEERKARISAMLMAAASRIAGEQTAKIPQLEHEVRTLESAIRDKQVELMEVEANLGALPQRRE